VSASPPTDKNEQAYVEGWEKVCSNTVNPFALNRPYEWIVELEGSGEIRGKVLDSGCGGGHNAIYLASQKLRDKNIDVALSEREILRAGAVFSKIAKL
jgi:2-polyprenyl-3-methyl-5-hydroxy-6-metoxy-1,4-benzoquinol methylase